MPKCTINGKEIEVREGASVIEAFAQMDEKIAHYCWHPGLSVAGVCRMCMVEVEGVPRLQIACNTKVNDGMVVTNQSEKVKEAVKWTLDFHLINHPLDCPICDQAGECGLQEQYMRFGRYEPEMSENKVKKQKAVDLGPTVVLDSERCILCSRCVRFTEEVSKTNELGIFNRGDRSEIGTFAGKPLDNNYSLNTVDICPVGALTSKEFRFKQRVWLLKSEETVCPGCSTGCNVDVYYNRVGAFRLKPRLNEEVNGYWMCDKGRGFYSHANREQRLLNAVKTSKGEKETLAPGKAAKEAGALIQERIAANGKESVALVVTAQYTSEELEASLKQFKEQIGGDAIYYWVNNKESFDEFDGILYRGDKNPNTKGLLEALDANGCNRSWSQLEEGLNSGKIRTLIVAGPEIQENYQDLQEKVSLFGKADDVIWLSTSQVEGLEKRDGQTYQIAMRSYLEKDGTFVNYKGLRQTIKSVGLFVSGALTLDVAMNLLAGNEFAVSGESTIRKRGRIFNELEKMRGHI